MANKSINQLNKANIVFNLNHAQINIKDKLLKHLSYFIILSNYDLLY